MHCFLLHHSKIHRYVDAPFYLVLREVALAEVVPGHPGAESAPPQLFRLLEDFLHARHVVFDGVVSERWHTKQFM